MKIKNCVAECKKS